MGQLAKLSTRTWLIVFAFVIGFATTVAEPALIAIARIAQSNVDFTLGTVR